MHHPPSLTRRQFFATTAAVAGAAAAHAAVPPALPPLAPEPPLPPGVFRRLGSARFRGMPICRPRFTTDGRWLVNEVEDMTLGAWDVRTGARLSVPLRKQSEWTGPRVVMRDQPLHSGDGSKRLEEVEGGYRLIETATSRVIAGVKTLLGTASRPLSLEEPTPSNDGRTVFAMAEQADGASCLVAIDCGTGRVRWYPAAVGEGFALSPDERTAVVCSSSALRVIDLESGKALPQSQDPVGLPLQVRYGTGGRVLAVLTDHLMKAQFDDDHPSWAVWDRPDAPSRPVPYLTHFPPDRRKPPKGRGYIFQDKPVFSLSPTADRYAAVGDYRIFIRDAGTHLIRHVIQSPLPKPVEGPFGGNVFDRPRVSHGHAWTPDGRYFALAAHELFTVLDTTTARRRAVGLPNDLGLTSLQISPNGRTVGSLHPIEDRQPGQPLAELVTAELHVGKFTRVPLPPPPPEWTPRYRPSADFRRVLCHFYNIEFFDPEIPFATITSVFDAHARRTVQEWSSSDLTDQAAFTPDGRTVFLATERRLGEDKGVEHAVETREVRTGERRWRAVLAAECLSLDVSADGRELLTAHPDAPVYLWDVFGEKSDPQPFPGPKRLRSAWAELAGSGEAAFRAVRLLVQHPAAAVELLGEKLKPLARPTDTWVRGRVQELGDREYAVRAAAERQLTAVAEGITDKLDEFRGEVETVEAAERFERVLAAVKHPPEAVRSCRAVEVLEHCRTSAAGKLLRALAAGPAGLTLTREAKEAVGRL